jgi:hypothetical protein
VFDVLELWTVMDEDERQHEREHPLQDHEPSWPGKERLFWPCDLAQAGADVRSERCGQLRKIELFLNKKEPSSPPSTQKLNLILYGFG